MTAGGVLLVLGSGRRPYREYLLTGINRHAPIWLIDEVPVTWQHPYVVGSTVVELLDGDRVMADQDRLLAAALAVADTRPVAGVLTYDEVLVPAVALIAERLGLPGLSVAGAEGCRDKARTRAALTEAGLPQPHFGLVDGLAQATRTAGRIGYPVVAKPRGMGASVGVVKADGPNALAAAFEVADRARSMGPSSYETGVLIEECVAGPELSIDAAVVGGEYHPFCLAHKQLGPAPYFEEIGHLVDAGDPLLTDPELLEVLATAHRCLGVRDGLTHTEVRLTNRGPVIIEINARLGGDLIPYLGRLATGIDPGYVAAQVALGTPPELVPTQRRCAAIRFLYPPEDCRVLGVTGPSAAAVAAIDGLAEARAIVEAGTVLRLPPNANLGRHGYLLAVAEDPAACDRALTEAAGLIELQYEPLRATEAHEASPW